MALADSEIAGVHPLERSNSPGQHLALCSSSASFEDGNAYSSKVTVKWPTNCATCFETLLQNELNCDVHVVPPSFKPVLQRIRLRQVALTLTSDWIKLCGSYVACCKTICLGPVKRATCQILKMKKWSLQWTQFMQLRKEAWKKFRTSTDLNPWPRDTGAMLYQLSYEATDVGSRSIHNWPAPNVT